MKSHKKGELETVKFENRRPKYEEYLAKLPDLGYEMTDYLHYFPAFAGKMTLNRYFVLYELYKKVLGISGHLGEVGVYKGASSLLFGKLVEIFEPESLTMVHGWDNFAGTEAVPENPLQVQGGNVEPEERLRKLIALQGMDNIVKVHKMDATCEWDAFFDKYPHLRFKLIFLDSGTYEVTAASIKALWPRLNVGGIMIFDQYANEVAPGETRAVTEFLPNQKIETITSGWMPVAYTIKCGTIA